jgi:hypothetical protein
MSNTIQTTDKITKQALACLTEQLSFVSNIDTHLSDEFNGNTGSTIRVKKPAKFTVSDSPNFSAQAFENSSADLTIDKTPAVYLSKTQIERLFSMTDAADRDEILVPAMNSLATKIDSDILAKTYKSFCQIGTPGTAPSTLSSVLKAAAAIREQGATTDIYGLMGQTGNAELVNGLSSLFNNQSVLAKQYDDGIVAKVGGIKFYEPTSNMPQHTVGTYTGTPLANSVPAQDGASIVTNGWGAGSTVLEGDIVTFADVYFASNPTGAVAHVDGSKLAQFVVDELCTADGSGNMTIKLKGLGVVASGKYQNCTAKVANDKAVTVISGASAAVKDINLVFCKEAVTAVFCELPIIKAVEKCSVQTNKKISIRFLEVYDSSTNDVRYRIEAAYGVASLRSELGLRFHG